MVQSSAKTVEEYLNELPEERRTVVSAVRDVILRNLPAGYGETMAWGGISYGIPLERYPNTYNKQPLVYVGLVAQKNYFALYLMGCYQDSTQEGWLREQFKQAGRRLDMGKSCLRFRRLDDLPLDVIGQVIASMSPDAFIAQYEAARGATKGEGQKTKDG